MRLQETRRTLSHEADEMGTELDARMRSDKLAKDKELAKKTGWARVGHLQEQLNLSEGRLDGAKQQLYFPFIKCYTYVLALPASHRRIDPLELQSAALCHSL